MRRRIRQWRRTKAIWVVTLPPDLWVKVRERAVSDATSVSDTLANIIGSVVDELELPEQPMETQVRLHKSGSFKAGRYFLPVELADKIEVLARRGYSNPYLMVQLVRAGLQKFEMEGV